MAITLGIVAFEENRTTVDEHVEEVGGRDARRIVLRGIVQGAVSLDIIEARLDAVAEAASREDYSVPLSIRPGRRYWVRRVRFLREVARIARVGTFELTLEARDPFEESTEETEVEWPITASGDHLALATTGNADTMPVITVMPSDGLVAPAFDDGTRSLRYTGSVGPGQVLVIDGPARRVWLDSDDVTPYTEGEFPSIAPAGTTLTYTGDPAGNHTATVTIAYRDRWW